MATEGSALVRRLFDEVFNQQRLDVLDEIVAAHYVEHAAAPFEESEPGVVAGPEFMRQVVRWLRAQFPDVSMTVVALVEGGGMVAARVLSSGTNTGPINGFVPPTGRQFSAEATHWYRVADDRLAEHWATRDDLRTMVQLGLIQRPGPGAAG